ncbi:MAG: hypothetical protein AAGF12_03345 [Myxococcota bacterium]
MSCALALAGVACSSSDDGSGEPAAGAPARVTLVTNSGFIRPGDAVSSHDGETFYFTGYTDAEDSLPAVFSVPSAGGSAQTLVAGTPLEYTTGLVMSCDNETLFVADQGRTLEADVDDEELASEDGADDGAIHAISTADGSITQLSAEGIAVPSGLALSVDCTTLYITGWNMAGVPAVFTLPVAGGAATEIHAGDPLVSPTGVHVDADNVAWVMDHITEGADGPGALFAITNGSVTEVVSNLSLGSPGGVSLTSAGGTAVIPTRDDEGNAQLLSISIASGEISITQVADLTDPAGIRTARDAAIFALVDSEGNAIYRAE